MPFHRSLSLFLAVNAALLHRCPQVTIATIKGDGTEGYPEGMDAICADEAIMVFFFEKHNDSHQAVLTAVAKYRSAYPRATIIVVATPNWEGQAIQLMEKGAIQHVISNPLGEIAVEEMIRRILGVSEHGHAD